MKTMKVALLASAALAAVSVSARADDTAAIKAQLEALTARIAQLEAAPALPIGFSLLTISDQNAIVVPGIERDAMLGKTATTVGITPTADMPASTVIQWSGYVRAALTYESEDGTWSEGSESGSWSEDAMHLRARGYILVTGTTDTAVGEVGAKVNLVGNFDDDGMADGEYDDDTYQNLYMDVAWGWWKMTPELTFAGGYAGSLATIGHGMEIINDAYISRGGVGVTGGDWTQLRLSWDSGPLGLALAVEHTDEGDNYDDGDGSPFGVAGQMTWAGDTFSAEVAGFIRDDGYDGESESQIGVGASMSLSEMFKLSAAAGWGHNLDYTDADGGTERDGDVLDVSVAVIASLTDSVSAELGVGYSNYDNGDAGDETDVWAAAGGVYWTPVDQLTIGANASWKNLEDDNDEVDQISAAFITWWRF